jgi:hypothetical protein
VRIFPRAILIFFLILLGCSSPKEYVFQPLDDISYVFELQRIKHRPDHNSVFVYFELIVTNNIPIAINFNPGDVKLQINEFVSNGTYYDSLGSVMTVSQPLIEGKTIYHLYSVFSEDIKDFKPKDIDSFLLESTGLNRQPSSQIPNPQLLRPGSETRH